MLVSAHGRPCCSADSIADPVTVGDPWQPIGRPCCSADSIADGGARESKRKADRGSNFDFDVRR